MNSLAVEPHSTQSHSNRKTGNTSRQRLLAVLIVMALSCFYSGKIYAGNNPVIVLKGDTGLLDTMKIEQGYSYTDPGDSAYSAVYGNITKDIIVTSTIVGGSSSFNNLITGTYVFSYNVTDPAGLKATTRYRVVRVWPDTIPPDLIVNKPDTVYFEVSKIPYGPLRNIYPSVKSDIDLVDGNLIGSVFIDTSKVQTTVVGVYPVIYSSTDLSGNKAVVYRYIDVIDSLSPVIKLVGPVYDSVLINHTYYDSGYYVSTSLNNTKVDTSGTFYSTFKNGYATKLGSYTIIYRVTDKSGKSDSVTRIVGVFNSTTILDGISLNGSLDVNVCPYSTYIDKGYTLNPSNVVGVTVDTTGTFLNYGTSKSGAYTLTYTARDLSGHAFQPVTRIIFVQPAGSFGCAGSSDSVDTTICKSGCPVFSAPISGDSYKWSTGDTSRSIQVCLSSDTVIYVSTLKGTSVYTHIYKITVTKTSCVWPGDANGDGVADNNDVLAIGVAYGDTGVKRPNASLTWTGQPCNDWASSFKSGANYKNADCNGDGTVDSTDMTAIYKNYGYTHSKANGGSGSPSDPPLSITFAKDSTLAGDTVTATISLGSSSIPVSNAYGLAFTIPYNFFYVNGGKASVNLSKCWLGTAGKNLVYFLKDDSTNSVIDFAVTRTDHKDMSGYGEIGTVSLVMQDNLGGKTWVNRTVVLTPSDVTLISSDETPIPLYAKSDSMIVTGPLASISNQASNALKDIMLYPNPASQNINIDPGNQILTGIRIVNVIGMVVFEQLSPARGLIQVPVSTLNSGMYTVIISSKNGTVVRQLIKN